MTNEYNKKITYFLLSCLLFGSMFISITKVAADIDRKEELQPGEYHIEKLQYNNQTASERRSTNRLRLINFAQEQEYLKFASESPMNVFLVNESETASWIANETINAKKSWENKTRINQDITYENLLNWGFEEKIFQKDSGENFKEISFYVVVVNQNTGVNSYTLRYDYENEFGSFVDEFFKHLIFLAFFGVGIKLMMDGKKLKETKANVSHIYKNYGLGLFIAGIATFSWKVYHWVKEVSMVEHWEDTLIFKEMPDSLVFSGNYLTWVTLSALGLSIVFMSNTIERDIQQKKKPYFTILLLAMQFLLVVGIFIPQMLLIIFIGWLSVLILTAFNILGSYIKLATSTAGSVRKKAIVMIIGLVLAYLMIALREFIRPEFISNSLGTIGVFIINKGIRMDIE